LKPRKNPFYAGLQGWWNSWHVENWQWASAGSVFATVLVLVVFWHEQPKDTVWKEAEPDQIATAEIAAGVAPAEEQAKPDAENLALENNRSGSSDNAGVKLRKAAPEAKRIDSGNAETEVSREVPSALPAAPAEKTVLADAETFTGQAESVARKAEAPLAAPAAAKGSDKTRSSVPETMTGSTINTAKDNTQVADAVSAGARTRSSALKEQAAALADGVQSKHKADGAFKPAEAVVGDAGNTALAAAISKAGGEVLANQDIKAGILRHLYLGEQVVAKNLQACAQSQPDSMPRVDSVTGYSVEFISGCNATDALIKEVAIYNQTMRAWHAKDGK